MVSLVQVQGRELHGNSRTKPEQRCMMFQSRIVRVEPFGVRKGIFVYLCFQYQSLTSACKHSFRQESHPRIQVSPQTRRIHSGRPSRSNSASRIQSAKDFPFSGMKIGSPGALIMCFFQPGNLMMPRELLAQNFPPTP